MMRDNLRILVAAFTSAFADLRVTYTWRTWSFAWLSRILFQVAFFALIGRLLGSRARLDYLLVGNAVFISAMVSMLVCASTAWERQTGTLPLLTAAPANPFALFIGRSVQWVIDGSLCSTIALFVLAPIFGISLPMPVALIAVPLIFLVACSTYCFGLALAGIVLRKIGLRNLVSGLASLIIMIVCGVQVPTAFWPPPISGIAEALPLTHGLGAIRDVLEGAAIGKVLLGAGLEVCVAAGWLAAASLIFRGLIEGGRRDGSIEFSE
jgi:ABC-2 type transport system permease protein